MSKLLTIGCSYTFYKWNTWADYLGKDFKSFTNKGIPGADNPTIARIAVSMAEPGDTVCIMWTSYQRHNYKIDYNSTYNWSEYHWGHNNINDKYYFTNIFNQYERFLTTLDYIEFVHADSLNRNYKVIHLSAFPFLYGQLNSPVNKDMQKKINEKKYFIDLIHKSDLWTFNQPYYKNIDNDDHPQKEIHEMFCNQIIKPLLIL
jgi:hypothetical protein